MPSRTERTPAEAELTELLCSRVILVQEAMGLTRSQYAKSLGVTPAYISQIATYYRRPSADLLKEIARLYGIRIGWFYGDELRPTKAPSPLASALLGAVEARASA